MDMATREITKAPSKGFERGTMIALIIVAASLIVTVMVAVSLQLDRSSPTRLGQPANNVTLGRQDDYALRHAPGAPVLGRDDDYALRQAPSTQVLGRDDDYALRH
jgi:hypothetical protein